MTVKRRPKGNPNREPTHAAPRAHPNGAPLIPPALRRATALVTIVRDEDAAAVARIIDGLTYEQMAAMVVVLAAMVPDDRSVADLTAWVVQPPALRALESVG